MLRLLLLCSVFPLGLLSVPNLSAQTLRLSPQPNQWDNQQIPLDSWGAISFGVRNSGDEGQDVFLTSFFEQHSDQQFGRQFWVPPHSIREGWYLVKTPPTDGTKKEVENKALNFKLIRRHGSVETAETPEANTRSEVKPIRCPKSPARTLLVVDPEDEDSASLVTAARTVTAKPGDFRVSAIHPLPPVVAAYEGWTHIILASNRVLQDQASMEALRQWTVQGGRLWILLDKTGLDAALPFLTGEAGLSVVDRVGLNSFQLDCPSKEFLISRETRELEEPVEMVRTIAEGFDTIYQVNGWDAAITTRTGKGFVLITTLGPTGWLKSTAENTNPNWRAMLSKTGYPTAECKILGEQFWAYQETVPAPELAAVATQYVGYPVMSLTSIASALSLFCLSILVGGIFLWRAERLAWMAWFAPTVAIMGTLWIGVTSHQNRNTIPPTEATIQIVEADPVGNIHIQGGTSVYSVADGDTNPQVTRGGQLEFVNPPVGQAKRLVWTDYGKVYWENLNLNTGVHEFRFQTHQVGSPSQAIFSFNEEGIIGRMTGHKWELPERGLIVSPNGQFAAPHFLADGQLVSTARDSLAPGRYSASSVIDDREQTRMDILEQLLGKDRPAPSEPRLYFWTDPLETGFQTQKEGRKVGDAFVGLPILFERPPAGTEIY
ncbi:MAG: hypothetical protein KDA84_14500, partial [Planctomycetaceae bacterium]|nr:hypothetical protein [Planctomycetaceae bacterium]